MHGWSSSTPGCSPTRHDAFPERRTRLSSGHCPAGSPMSSTNRRWPRSWPTSWAVAGGPASSPLGSVAALPPPTRHMVSTRCCRRCRTSRPPSNALPQSAPGARPRYRIGPYLPRRRSRPVTSPRSGASLAWPPPRPARPLPDYVRRVRCAVLRAASSSPVGCGCAPPASERSNSGRRGWWRPGDGPISSSTSWQPAVGQPASGFVDSPRVMSPGHRLRVHSATPRCPHGVHSALHTRPAAPRPGMPRPAQPTGRTLTGQPIGRPGR